MLNKLAPIFNQPFPEHECTIQNKADKNVYESDKEHYVLFQYKDESNNCFEIRRLYPYIFKDIKGEYSEGKSKVYYAWTDGHNVFSNKVNQIHTYDDLVAIGND